MATSADRVSRAPIVITNNHNLGKAVVNALQIKALTSNNAVPVPEILLEHNPVLASVARAQSDNE